MADLYATDSRGVYIPQFFAESCKREMVFGVSPEDWQILENGPDYETNPGYWDAWDSVIQNAKIKTPNGQEGFLWQDGDLWVIWGENDPDYKSFFSDEW